MALVDRTWLELKGGLIRLAYQEYEYTTCDIPTRPLCYKLEYALGSQARAWSY